MFPIIEKLGGWSNAKGLLEKQGIGASDVAHRQWRSRKYLPQNVRLALKLEAAEQGVAVSDADCAFVKTDPALAAE